MIQNIFIVLLFLIPGMIAVSTEENLSDDCGRPKSDLDKAIEAIILSMPVFIITLALIELVNWVWVCKYDGQWWGIRSISIMQEWLNSFKHLILYTCSSTISAVIIGLLFATQNKKNSIYIRFLDFGRKKLGKAEKSGFNTVWEEVVNNSDEIVVSLKSKEGGSEVKGFLRGFSQSGDKPREVTIDSFDVVEKFKGYFDDKRLVYFNFDTGTIITFYDMTYFNDYCKKLKEVNHPSLVAEED